MEIIKKMLPKKYRWMTEILKNAEKEDVNNLVAGWKNRKQYYQLDHVQANMKDILKCANCPNMCRFDCPALQITKNESYAPASKARIAYLAANFHLGWEEEGVIDAFYACTTCQACYQWCPMDIRLGDRLVEMRYELEARNLIPDKLQILPKRIDQNGTIFESNPFRFFPDFEHNDSKPEVFYYIGCMDLKYRPNTVKATIAILEFLKIPFCTKMDERSCCGNPVRKAGFKKKAIEIAKKNESLITATKAKTIITNCPGCLQALKEEYELLGIPIKADVLHSATYWLKMIHEKRLKLIKKIEKPITFHDPCLIARREKNLNTANDLQEILKIIPAAEWREPICNNEETRCCGMGGAYAVSNPKFAKELRAERLKELQNTGANIIISACPTCEYAFGKAQQEQNSYGTEIFDLTEIIARAAGIEYI